MMPVSTDAAMGGLGAATGATTGAAVGDWSCTVVPVTDRPG
jgi:hypothetical protein